MNPPWRGRLLHCLNGIQAAGDFAWSDTYRIHVNPGLRVDEECGVPLPLTSRDAQAIQASFQAHRKLSVGDGDAAASAGPPPSTCDLDSAHFCLLNPEWPSFLTNDLLAPALHQLGLVLARLRLRKLVLDGSSSSSSSSSSAAAAAAAAATWGKHAAPPTPGVAVVGTFVVCLPSAHVGGDVRLSWAGETRVYATGGPSSRFDITALAWFQDVAVQWTPPTAGTRLALVYDIMAPPLAGSGGDNRSGSLQTASAALYSTDVQQLQGALAAWHGTGDNAPFVPRVFYPLEHRYRSGRVSLDGLRGRDRAVCQDLQEAAGATGTFLVFLGTVVPPALAREDGKYADLEALHTLAGEAVSGSVFLAAGENLSPERFRSSADGHGLCKTVVVIAAMKWLAGWVFSMTTLYVDPLIALVGEIFKNNRDNQEAVAQAKVFIRSATYHNAQKTLPLIVEWGLALGDNTLYDAAVRAGYKHTDFRALLAQRILQSCCDRAGPQGLGTADWTAWLGAVLKPAPPLTALRAYFIDFSSCLDVRLRHSFSDWKDNILVEQFQTRQQFGEDDLTFILDLMQSRPTDDEWLVTCLLPSVCSRANDRLKRELLKSLFGKSNGRPFSRHVVREAHKFVLGQSFNTYLEHDQTQKYRGQPEAALEFLDRCLSLGLADAIWDVVRSIRRKLQQGCAVPARFWVADAVLDYASVFYKAHGRLDSVLTPAFKALLDLILAREFDGVEPDCPIVPHPAELWTLEPQGCGQKLCVDCKKLDKFLATHTDTCEIISVPSQARASHLKERLTKCGQRVSVKLESKDGANELDVVLQKVDTKFRPVADQFDKDNKRFRALSPALAKQYFEGIADSSVFRPVLDAPSPPVAGVKRPATEELDDETDDDLAILEVRNVHRRRLG